MTVEYWQQRVEVNQVVSKDQFLKFAELTNDDALHHIDISVAQSMGYQDCIGQGLFVLSITGEASSRYLELINKNGVTYGYEKLRFPAPVYSGESITITYEPESISEKNVLSSKITVKKSSGEVALAGTHLLKILK